MTERWALGETNYMAFTWPEFSNLQPIDGGRSWTATFESYDQHNERCFYEVRVHDDVRSSEPFTVEIGTDFAGNDWSGPAFLATLTERIAIAARAQEAIVLCPMPSLVATLLNREKAKGSPLTEVEVLQIRDECPTTAVPLDVVRSIDESRGYQDIDPERAWEEWQEARQQLL